MDDLINRQEEIDALKKIDTDGLVRVDLTAVVDGKLVETSFLGQIKDGIKLVLGSDDKINFEFTGYFG